MRWLDVLDRNFLEPAIRKRFPEPADRRIGVKIIHSGQSDMRFLCLSGAFCLDAPSNWAGWIRLLRREFPNADITVLNGFYFYWASEVSLIEEIIDLGRKVVADNKPTYIIAFSFGGLLAKRIVTQQNIHDVRAILTLATEHRGHLPRIANLRDTSLRIPLHVGVPLLTFGGLFDPIVWPWTTYTGSSVHRTLAVDHFSFMRSARTRQQILTHLYDIIFKSHHAR